MRDDDQPSRPDQPLRVAVRAYARHRQPPRPRTRWAWTRRPGAARFLLVLDTETTTDPSQRLVFGVYRLGEVRDDPRTGEESLTVFEEGFVYGDDLPARDPAGFAILETYVGAHRAETAPGESTALRFLSRTAFVNEVLYPAAFEGQAIVVGFNLPFDLSRLAVEASPARHRGRWWPMGGGWSFVLWRGPDGRPHRYRPRLVIKHGDKTRAQIAFTSADYQPTPKRRTRRPLYRGRFLDLKTLTFALTDRSHSLASACVAFGVATAKHSVDQHGVITPDYLEYGRQDVRATQGLYLATRQEYQRHALDAMPWDIKSPASIAKGYLRTMGISNPMDRVIGLTPDQLGAAAAAYFGGQAEVRIRHTVVPVVATDVTSMYPTVNVLAQLQTYLTAAVLRSEACTAEAQRVLDQITLERVLDPVTWPTLRFFAEILPDDDHLPVRAAFGGEGGSYTLSVNPYTSDQTAWYAGFDLARSILATGRVPQIRRAFRMAAEGQLATLTPVAFQSEQTIDPRTDDIFKTVIEARHRIKREAAAGRCPPAIAEARERAYKVFANSGSYGIFAELNPEDWHAAPVTVVATMGQGRFEAATRRPEAAGEFYFPPTAALITSGARLLLGVMERLVTDRGGTYLAVDTDSMLIVATEAGGLVRCDGGPARMPSGASAVRALSWAQVDEVVAAVDRLKPYGPAVTDPLLKIEKENFVNGQQIPLFGLATSTKRYCLFTEGPEGVVIRKRSKAGLGVLLPPDDRPEDPDQQATANDGWQAVVWRSFVRRARGQDHDLPTWADRPAVVRFAATSPRTLSPFAARLARQAYADRLKPFNFLLTVHLAALGTPAGADPQQCRLVTGFEKDPRRWPELIWGDLYSDVTCRLSLGEHHTPGTAVVTTVRDFVEQYWAHPEAKSLAPDGSVGVGTTRGLLRQRPITPSGIDAVGKEINRLEDVEHGLIADPEEVQTTYRPVDRRARAVPLRAQLLDVPADELAREAGVSLSTAFRFRRGQPVRADVLRRFQQLVDDPEVRFKDAVPHRCRTGKATRRPRPGHPRLWGLGPSSRCGCRHGCRHGCRRGSR